jgi:hypothetical protein
VIGYPVVVTDTDNNPSLAWTGFLTKGDDNAGYTTDNLQSNGKGSSSGLQDDTLDTISVTVIDSKGDSAKYMVP